MTAEFGPIEAPPWNLYPPHADAKGDALRAALGDMELGEYDALVFGWLAGQDIPTVATVVAWIERAKKATVKDLESRLNDAYYERDCLRDELDALREGGAQ